MTVLFDEGILQNAQPLMATPIKELRAKFGAHPRYLKADSLDDLARQLDVPAATLRTTVAEYNAAVELVIRPSVVSS